MSRVMICPATDNGLVAEEFEEVCDAKRDRGALLFGACPQCSEGDLLVWRREQAVVARCIACGYAGALSSVYPWPGPAAERHPGLRPHIALSSSAAARTGWTSLNPSFLSAASHSATRGGL
jgi:hypothetical protein